MEVPRPPEMPPLVSDFEPKALAEETRPVFKELKEHGIKDMTEPSISKEELFLRTKEYYRRCNELPTELFCKMAKLPNVEARFAFINNRLLIELAKDSKRIEELKESFGSMSWLELVECCPNLSIPEEGFGNLPRKAILALMVSNNPWNDYFRNLPPPKDLKWTEIFDKDQIEPEYADAWKYLTFQRLGGVIGRINPDIRKRIFMFIATPSAVESVEDLIELCMRIVYLECFLWSGDRIYNEYGHYVDRGPTLLDLLKAAITTLKNTVVPLQARMAKAKHGDKVLMVDLPKMFSRPPQHIPHHVAHDLYGPTPPEDTKATVSKIENDLRAWSALIDDKYLGRPYCKFYMMMRSNTAFPDFEMMMRDRTSFSPDEILHSLLSIITNKGDDRLPFGIIDSLVKNLPPPEYRETRCLLKSCFNALSRYNPSLAVECALQSRSARSFYRMVMEDASKKDMRQALMKLLDDPAIYHTAVLPDFGSEHSNLLKVIREVSSKWKMGSPPTKIIFVTASGDFLPHFEATKRLLKYLDILFDPKGARAFIWHEASDGYFPAHLLSSKYMEALVIIFQHLLASGHAKLPYKISAEYFERMQRPGPSRFREMYGDFVDAGQDVMMTKGYEDEENRLDWNNYTPTPEEKIMIYGSLNPVDIALLCGELTNDGQDSGEREREDAGDRKEMNKDKDEDVM